MEKVLNRSSCVVSLGEVLWDVQPGGRTPGGAPANFACHVAQFGLPTLLVSAVGADALGDELRGFLSRQAFEPLLATVQEPTGTVHVALDQAGVPHYDIRTEVAWDYIPFTPALDALSRQAAAVCFGSLAQRSPVSHATIQRFVSAMARRPDTWRIFDVNLRPPFADSAVVRASIRLCNVLKLSDEELPVVARMEEIDAHAEPEAVCRTLLERHGLRYVVLTCGARGSWVYAADGTARFSAAPRVRVASTVGAGDSFTAAFAAALLRGCDARQAHELATRVSAYVCTQNGAMPVLPDYLKDKLR